MSEERNTAGGDREAYFQAVSRDFLLLRGAPLQISSRELLIIQDWFERSIPLHVVRDGLRSAYEEFRRRPRRGKRAMSLVFCDPRVRLAFAQHRDRKIGSRGEGRTDEARRREALEAVDAFLSRLPESIREIRPIFLRSRRELGSEAPDESRLEKMENEIEDRLLKGVSPRLREEAERLVRREFGPGDPAERSRLVNLTLLKRLREDFQIPHVSLFYYS